MDWIAQLSVEKKKPAWVLAVVIATAAGWLVGLYTREWRENAQLSNLALNANLKSIELLAETLNSTPMGAAGLLGLIDEEVKKEARGDAPPNTPRAVALMENVARAYGADGAFIVGRDGIIQSSWGIGPPLTGTDVKFRPYVQMAMSGTEGVYPAIGVATGRRSLYFAAPIFSGKMHATPIIGVIVIRAGVGKLDRLLSGAADIALLLSPQGLVFAAHCVGNDWVGRSIKKLSPEQLKEVRELRQFGNLFETDAPEPLPIHGESAITTFEGKRHAMVQASLEWKDPSGDWRLVLMEDLSRTAPNFLNIFAGLIASGSTLLGIWLFYTILSGHHARVLASKKLDAYMHAQQSDVNRKSRMAAAVMYFQQAKTMEELGQSFLTEANALLGCLQGAVYIWNGRIHNRFQRVATYACMRTPPEEILLGEGLLGQCALERCTLTCEVPDEFYLEIRSGVGAHPPMACVLTPILLNKSLLGMVEVAFFEQPTEGIRQALEDLTALLAFNVEILRQQEDVGDTLEKAYRAEQAMAEQVVFQQTLIDTIPYPIFYKGPDTRFLGFNRAYEQVFAVHREDLIGKRVLDLMYLPEADRVAYQAEDEATIANVGHVVRMMKIPFVDGNLHDTLYSVYGFRKPDGSPGGLIGTFIDLKGVRAIAGAD